MAAVKKDHFETILSLIAAIASSVAAIGAFSTGFYQMQAVNLERIPAIHLACRPEYVLAEAAAHVERPEDTLLLRPSGGEWVHVSGAGAMTGMPGMSGMGGGVDTPDPFARCTVKNFGRLPLLDMHLPTRLSFTNSATGAVVRSTFVIDLPGLSADAEYEFSLLNGSSDLMQVSFERTVLLAALDGNGQVSQHLFVDGRVAEIERMRVEPGDRGVERVEDSGTLVDITNFTYRPLVLRVRSGSVVTFANMDAEAHTVTAVDGAFDSGTLDPGQRWKRRFERPGRYVFRCAYHPYMHGEVDVR
jgi:plastocyanin